MQNKISYKYISDVDVQEIEHLEQLSFDSTIAWTVQMIQDAVTSQTSKFFIAYYGEQIIGYCLINDLSCEFELLRICVIKEYRKLGIAYGLMQFVVDYLKQLQIVDTALEAYIFLEVSFDNFSALKLYEKCGFERIAVRKNYYLEAGKYKDAIIMRLFL